MKISAINSFHTNKIQTNFQKNNVSFRADKIAPDEFIKKWKETPATPLDKKDAQYILDEGEILLKKYDESTTQEERDVAIRTYKLNVQKTISKKKDEYRVLRHYWGNHFSIGGFVKYEFAKESSADEEEKRKIIEDIVRETKDIINFDQSLRTNENGNPNKLSLKSVFTQIIKNEESILKDRNINIEVNNIDKIEKENAFAFENYTIMSNLVQNAIKYSPDNSTIKINFVEEEVLIKGKHPKFNSLKDFLFFEIEDEGIGIPKEDQENIFNAGVRGNNVGSIQGTGQGLSDVKNSITGGDHQFIQIISPLRENEPIYKGTKIRCPLNI